MSKATTLPDDKQLLAMEEQFDPEMRFRPSVPLPLCSSNGC